MRLSKTALTAVLVMALALPASAQFTKTESYTAGQFKDVTEAEWFANDVASSYELGFMNGVSNTEFSPKGNVTVAQAITIAARANAANSGKTIDTKGDKWYDGYVKYAIENGIMTDGQFDSYDRAIKRSEMAVLFHDAMPDGYFSAKNDVAEIPDVSETRPYHDDLLDLYKAGVVMGSDSYGNFRPEDNITRAEAAAIINRVAIPENRLSKTLDKLSDDDAYLLAPSRFTGLSQSVEGLRSGWLYDNRGSAPQSSLYGSYSALVDISETDGSAFIREFNRVSTGKVVLDTSIGLSENNEGAYIEYQNDEGATVYRLEVKDGAWQILLSDGKYQKAVELKNMGSYLLHVELDLDNNRAKTFIDGSDYGTYPLCTAADKTNIVNYRVASTDEGTPNISLGRYNMAVNYSAQENFDYCESTLPFDWKGSSEIYVKSATLYLPGSTSAYKEFTPVSGNVIAETTFILPNSESISYTLKSGAKEIAAFTTDKDNFYVNGEKVYENYYGNLWYRLRLELDTDNQTILVKINGRKVAEVAFANASTSVDNFTVANASSGEIQMDSFKVYRQVEHEDYVPEPVVPKGEDKYNVGMNVCSLWVNEFHSGWACVTPYDEIKPVLGYYQEGNPELADWEIKYIVEHGIDFQAFCVFFNSTNSPLNLDNTRNHLFNGFMNAKYSDMTKFCMLWEAANGASPNSLESFKNYYVPYFIENFFKDDRYMVIDNKPILIVFGADALASRAGGEANVKEMFDYLEQVVRDEFGYDGMIYVASNSNASYTVESMGFDAVAAYNWSTTGYSLEVNKSSNLANARYPGVYTIPTISVGFNNIGWSGTGVRYPLMTAEDYKAAQEWVKNEYLPTYAKETWQENLVMLSTWNEYGEGTYIMPTAEEDGFKYLDALREAYTDEKADASVNTVPTEAQKARITRDYPQYRSILRRKGFVKDTISEDDLQTVYTIEYNKKDKFVTTNIPEINFTNNGAIGISSGDALIICSVNYEETLDNVPAIRLNIKVAKGEKIQIFYTTSADPNWSESKSFVLTSTSDEMTSYTISTSGGNWKTKLTGLRVDPVEGAGKPFLLKSVELLGLPYAAPKKMIIDGNEFENFFRPAKSAKGDLCVAFDPAVALDFRLGAFYTWDKAEGKLTLAFKKHTVVYTVGSSKYTLDGKEMDLGYEIAEIDGLPIIPIQKLCGEIGYSFKLNNNGVAEIETDNKWYYDEINNRTPNQWEFNTVGDTEGWNSTFMGLSVGTEGYMSCISMSDSTDPTILLGNVEFRAEKYSQLEYRVRYSWNQSYKDDPNQYLTMYYITNNDKRWSESKTLKVKLNGKSSNGEWETYTVNTADYPLWKDTIVSLRFDPFNAVGKIDVDYIKFIEDPNYIPLEERPFSIVNSDAEDTSDVAFTDSKNKMKIVEDPDNLSNHCYLVTCDDIQIWLYSRQSCYFKPGATYKASVDVRLASYGTQNSLSSDFVGEILANMQYNDPDTGKVDHVVGSMKLGPNEWKTFTFEFTVNPKSSDRTKDVFSLYTNPINGIGVGYYFDNIVVEEILPE